MIEINNLTTNSVDEKFLKKVAEKVLEGESASWRKKGADLSIALIGQGRIRELNKRYRGKNRATDVLVFPELKVVKAQEVQGLGEIIICFREVKKNAKKYKSSFEKELARVLIHGILHLLGYDHEKSKATALKMEEKQNYYLSKI
ncbi:MAG: rRNA maturation RNase YbeY [Parcubacteria group bacterium CG2_30_36_18]|nr:MAG: rRNA maturation RNase YbeY [Parcubacteria group bacterium CG2_30_36_18]